MDWDTAARYALLFSPLLMAITLTIVVKKTKARDSSEDK